MRVANLALAMALAPTVALAQPGAQTRAPSPKDFKLCDGYGAPNRNGDGMTKQAGGFLGIFRPASHAGDLSREAPEFSVEGVAACDRALVQDERLLAKYHLRRANLLRSRGLHRLGLGQFEQAIVDLDAADAEGKLSGQPLYDRSMGVGNRLFRAYALARAFKIEEAGQLLAEAKRLRPYSAKVMNGATHITMAGTGDWNRYQTDLESMATFHPEVRQLLFFVALDNGDFAKAVEVRPLLDFTPPRSRLGGYRLDNVQIIHGRLFIDETIADAHTAFALAATGRHEEAAALIATTSARLDDTMEDLPLKPNGRKQSKEKREIHRIKQIMVPRMRLLLQAMEGRLALLDHAQKGDETAFFSKAEEVGLPTDGVGVHLLETLRTNLQPGSGLEQVESDLAETRTALRERRKAPELRLVDLYNAMPGAEVAGNFPKYKGAKNFLGENTGNGFITLRDGPVTQINFGGNNATSSVVEEMALLRAAEMALAEDHSHFALLSKKLTQRTLRSYGMYGGGESPMGFSADVRFVTFAAEGPPAPYEALTAHSIDAAKVVADLGPIYKTERTRKRRR